MKEIPLSNTEDKVLVDDEDWEFLISFAAWNLHKKGYPRCSKGINGKKKLIKLHDLVLQRMGLVKDEGLYCDHKNGNKLDNQRANLRLATVSANNANRKLPRNSSGYRGVYKNLDKWTAQIAINGKPKHLGRFTTPEEAAVAYNKAALEQYGEFAVLNEVKQYNKYPLVGTQPDT